LTISESVVPKQYQPVLRRLLLAVVDAKTRQLMDAEDDLIYELKQYSRAINDMKDEVKKAITEKEKAIA